MMMFGNLILTLILIVLVVIIIALLAKAYPKQWLEVKKFFSSDSFHK